MRKKSFIYVLLRVGVYVVVRLKGVIRIEGLYII